MTTPTELILTIYEHGCYSGAGRHAIAELAKGGESALDAFLLAQRDPPQSRLHPRDLYDTIYQIFGAFARSTPDALIDRFESGLIDEFTIYWAHGSAAGERSIDVLIAGLKSKEKFSPWAAAESLIRRKCERAVGPLIDGLSDRSALVKFDHRAGYEIEPRIPMPPSTACTRTPDRQQVDPETQSRHFPNGDGSRETDQGRNGSTMKSRIEGCTRLGKPPGALHCGVAHARGPLPRPLDPPSVRGEV